MHCVYIRYCAEGARERARMIQPNNVLEENTVIGGIRVNLCRCQRGACQLGRCFYLYTRYFSSTEIFIHEKSELINFRGRIGPLTFSPCAEEARWKFSQSWIRFYLYKLNISSGKTREKLKSCLLSPFCANNILYFRATVKILSFKLEIVFLYKSFLLWKYTSVWPKRFKICRISKRFAKRNIKQYSIGNKIDGKDGKA